MDWRSRWEDFWRASPGTRFEDSYRRRRSAGPASLWLKVLTMAGGVVLLIIGALFAVAPGPAGVFFVAGGVLLARESLWAARALDWIDRKSQPFVKACARQWRRLSPLVRRSIVLGATCMSIGTLVAGILLLRR